MANDEENSTNIEMVEFLSSMTPGETPEEFMEHYDTVDTLLERYQDPKDLLWLVSALVEARGNWETYGKRNAAINAMAAALGVEGKPMREPIHPGKGNQRALYCMTVGICGRAIRDIHKRAPEDRDKREEEASTRLAVELPRIHQQFSRLSALDIREKLRKRRRNSAVPLAVDLAVAVGFPWKLKTVQKEYEREKKM